MASLPKASRKTVCEKLGFKLITFQYDYQGSTAFGLAQPQDAPTPTHSLLAEGGRKWRVSSVFYLLTGIRSGRWPEKNFHEMTIKGKILCASDKDDSQALKKTEEGIGVVMRTQEIHQGSIRTLGCCFYAWELDAACKLSEAISEPWESNIGRRRSVVGLKEGQRLFSDVGYRSDVRLVYFEILGNMNLEQVQLGILQWNVEQRPGRFSSLVTFRKSAIVSLWTIDRMNNRKVCKVFSLQIFL